MAGLTKKGDVYYALFSIKGKTKWKRIGKVSHKAAKEYIKKLESGSDSERLGLIEITPITFEQCCNQFLAYAKIKKNLSRLPKIELLKVQKKPPRFLSEGELESFLESSGLWLYYILIVLRNSGMRSKSLKELRLVDANFDNNLLTILMNPYWIFNEQRIIFG